MIKKPINSPVFRELYLFFRLSISMGYNKNKPANAGLFKI